MEESNEMKSQGTPGQIASWILAPQRIASLVVAGSNTKWSFWINNRQNGIVLLMIVTGDAQPSASASVGYLIY